MVPVGHSFEELHLSPMEASQPRTAAMDKAIKISREIFFFIRAVIIMNERREKRSTESERSFIGIYSILFESVSEASERDAEELSCTRDVSVRTFE